jgi:hypothetical protein
MMRSSMTPAPGELILRKRLLHDWHMLCGWTILLAQTEHHGESDVVWDIITAYYAVFASSLLYCLDFMIK